MAESTIAFVANEIYVEINRYSPQTAVYLIAFVGGDPEDEDTRHSWNFSRASDVPGGYCTVKEPQQATLYGGIESLRMSRTGIECVFVPKAAEEAGCRTLKISFEVDDKRWKSMADAAKVIFDQAEFFSLVE